MRPSLALLVLLAFASCWGRNSQVDNIRSNDTDANEISSLETDTEQDVAPAPSATEEAQETPKAEEAREVKSTCTYTIDVRGLEKALRDANILFTGDACPAHIPKPLEEIRWTIGVAFMMLPEDISEEEAKKQFADRARWLDLVIKGLKFNKNLRYKGKLLADLEKDKRNPFPAPIVVEMLAERLAYAIILEDEAGQNTWGLHLADYYARWYTGEDGRSPSEPGVASNLYLMLGEKEHAVESAQRAVNIALNIYAGTLADETHPPGKVSDIDEAIRWIRRTDEITGVPVRSNDEMADLLRNFAYRARLDGLHSAANSLHAYASTFDTTPIDDSLYGTSPP